MCTCGFCIQVACCILDHTAGKYQCSTRLQQSAHSLTSLKLIKYRIYFAITRVASAVLNPAAFRLAVKFFITGKFLLFQAASTTLDSHLPTLSYRKLNNKVNYSVKRHYIYRSTFAFMASLGAFVNSAF